MCEFCPTAGVCNCCGYDHGIAFVPPMTPPPVTPMSNTERCPDSPGTGEVYHCSALDCPIHGERNKLYYKT